MPSHLEAARQLLPWWATWGPLLFTPPAVFVASFLLTRLALLWPLWAFSGRDGQHWAERARWAYPVAQVMAQAPLLLTFVFAAFCWLLMSRLLLLPVPALVTVVAVLAFLGSSFGCHLAAHQVIPGRIRYSDWPRGLLIVVVSSGWVIVLMLAIVWMPGQMDATAWTVLGLGAAGILFFTTGCGWWLARLFGVVYPAPERLRLAVERAAQRRNQPTPPVFVLNLPSVNAYAVLFLGWLMFTREAEAMFADEELEAISAHELAHLNEPFLAKLGRLGPSIALIPFMATWPVFNAFGLWGILAIGGLFVGVSWLAGMLSRHLERVADEAGKGYEASEGLYARALEKLYEANLAPAVMPGKGGSHPHLYDRLTDAGVTPEYERPSAPSRWRAAVPLIFTLIIGVVAIIAPTLPLLPASVPTARMALYGPTSFELATLAREAEEEERFEDAAVLYAAAGHSDEYSISYPWYEVLCWAQAGRMAERDAAFKKYQRRMAAGPPKAPGWLEDLFEQGPGRDFRDAVLRLGGK
jgi:Zn-dependent protease with chaperone function